jgi:thioredoxin-like negative regulator of GroEL
VRVAEAGLKRFADSRFLWDHVGFATSKIAFEEQPSAAQMGRARKAADAFRKALTLQPDTYHAHLGLYQALDRLGEPEEALQQLEVAAKAATAAGEQLPLLPLLRGIALLHANKPADAVTSLQSDALPSEFKPAAQILTLRAYALAGDAAKVAAQIEALQKSDDSPRAALEGADALLWLGRKEDAMKLLAKKPAPAKEGDDEVEQAQLAQSFAALELFANATDFGAASPTRIPLGKALGHRFAAFLPDKSGKTREVDLSSSPVMMSSLLVSAPPEPMKDWANRLLQALCIEAMPAHKPSADESFLRASTHPRGAEDLPAVLVAMRYALADPNEPCGLASRRAAEKLQGKPPAAKK